jgi:hypothetical protein
MASMLSSASTAPITVRRLPELGKPAIISFTEEFKFDAIRELILDR